MGWRSMMAMAVLGGAGYVGYGYGSTLLDAARRGTRENCLSTEFTAEVCDCVADRTWNLYRAVKFAVDTRAGKPIDPELMFDKQYAEMQCLEEHAAPGRPKVLGMLARECVDEVHEQYGDKTIEFCTCVAAGVSANPDVVSSLRPGHVEDELVERTKIGNGGLKVASIREACDRRVSR